ncbi:MAG: hypothetical protein WBA93_20120 [Microcoleaceae cyanobacterium]
MNSKKNNNFLRQKVEFCQSYTSSQQKIIWRKKELQKFPLFILIISASLLKILVVPSLFPSLISAAYAQEENSSEPAKRKISVPFFEEERRLEGEGAGVTFNDFSNTFLNDALGGTGDPMGGATAPGSDFTMSPNVSDSEFSDPTRGVRGVSQPGGGNGDRVSPPPLTGGPGRGIFDQLPPR